jgi:hypothetical protein
MRRLMATAVMLLLAALPLAAQVGSPVARPTGLVARPGDSPLSSPSRNGTTPGDDSGGHFCFTQDSNCRSRLGLQGLSYVPYTFLVPTPLYEFVPTDVVGADVQNDPQNADLPADVARQNRANRELQAQLAREGASREPAPPAAPAAKPAAQKSDPPPPPAPPPDVPDGPTTILVFRDGTHTEVMNYAIMGDALFELDAHVTKKHPLSEIDIPATIKLNNERGVTFLTPGKS